MLHGESLKADHANAERLPGVNFMPVSERKAVDQRPGLAGSVDRTVGAVREPSGMVGMRVS